MERQRHSFLARAAMMLLLTMLTSVSAWAQDSWSSDMCNVTLSGGTLTVRPLSDTGAMLNYTSSSDRPWDSQKGNITSIVIGSGVKNIGDYAFSGFTNLRSVTFEANSHLATIGNCAFNGCNNTNFTSITIPASVTSIGNDAFNGCNNLDKVYVQRSAPVPTLGNDAFSNCSSSLAIYVPTTDYSSATNWSTYASIIKIGGICGASGDNVTWLFADKDGDSSLETITISGTGDMVNYSDSSSPWDPYWGTITSVVIEDGVTSIGERAFRYLTKVTTISFGSNLTTIGNSAFELCNGLTSVTIPVSVTSIGTKAFNNCSKLESINVDADNANYASEDGVLLNKAKETLIQYPGGKSGSYTIPASVTTIGDNAFYKCSIASVTIPANVTSIGIYAFYQCTNLSSVTFEANSQLKTIGESAFNACNNTNFTSITIPASVTYIGWCTFYGCSNLTTITLNSNPCIFKDAAFPNGATVKMNLTATVGANGEYWMTFYTAHNNYQVPAGTQIFKAELSDDKLTLRELTTDKIVKEGKAVILKSTTASITLTRTTSASSNDFDTNNSLSGVFKAEGKEVTENPSTIYALNSGTQGVGFYKVPTGSTLGVGNAYVTSTSTSDFLPLVTVVASGNCGTTDHESDVTWELADNGTLTISGTGTGAMADFGWANQDNKSPFCNNTNITSIVIGEGVTSIGNKAFLSCSNLATVSIPSTLATIGDHAFHSCSNLTTISVAAGNTNFATEDGILYNYDKTTAILCPAKKGGAIALPATVTTLPTSLFNGNTNITSLDLSACTNLTTISGSLCYGCTALASVTLPASVSIIDQMAFEGCNNLTTINLSQCSSLNEIRTQAFNGCALLAGTHTLPNTITSIGSYAFNNCAALQELVIQSPFTTFAANGFGSSTFDGCTLLKLSISDTDLAEDMLSNTNHNWHRYAYMLKTMPFTASGVTLSPILNNISATLDMTSNTAVEVAKDIAVSNVNLTCTLTEGKPCTVMFPFASTPYFIGGGTFYEFTGVEYNGTLGKWIATMTAKDTYDDLAANTPYLLVPTSTAFASDIYVNGMLNTTTNSKQTVVGDWTFKGVYAEKTWAAADCGNDYGFAATNGTAVDGETAVAAGDFVKLAAGAHIKPMRAYLTYTGAGNPWATTNAPRRAASELPQSISVVLVNTDGSTTEIGTLTPSYSDSEGVWYSLDGVRLNGKPTTKGLYINNGRKVVLK